jgi:hypothetical protein
VNRLAVGGVLVILGIAAGGCSSSTVKTTSSSSASRSAAAETSSASTASTKPGTGGSAKLSDIVLQPTDLPTGWDATPSSSDPQQEAADQAALVQCVGGRNTFPDRTGEVDSPDFSLDGASISSNAASYKSQADLDADIALIKSPKASACFEKLVNAQLSDGLDPGESVGPLSLTITPGSAGGPSNVAGTGTGTVTIVDSGQQIPVYLEVAFITGPLIEAEVTIATPSQPMPAAMLASLIGTVATRAAKG